jgi:hypothetical protein
VPVQHRLRTCLTCEWVRPPSVCGQTTEWVLETFADSLQSLLETDVLDARLGLRRVPFANSAAWRGRQRPGRRDQTCGLSHGA